MRCPICNTSNKPGVNQCKQCGHSLAELRTEMLSAAEKDVRENADSPGAWIGYADALYESNRLNEARTALDKALPLFPTFSWSLYREAALSYAQIGEAEFAERLLADGFLYHLEHHRDQLDVEEIDEARGLLLSVAYETARQAFNKEKPQDRAGRRRAHELVHGVSFDQDPRPDLKNLAAYELATKLASPQKKRLYPGSPNMTAQSSGAVATQQSNQRLIMWLVIGLIVVVLFACLLSRCQGAPLP